MADSKISALTSGSAIAATDVFPAVETTGTGPVKKTAAQIKTWAQQGVALTANNLSDLGSASTARTNLGLGSVVTYNIGTSAYNIIQLDVSAKLPAVDGTQLTGVAKPTDKLSVFASTSSAELSSVISDETGSGSLVFSISPTFVTPNLGTPSYVTLTNATGLPVSTGVSGLGSGVSVFLGTPSSANLASALTDKTGTGSAVFANSPVFVDDITLGAQGASGTQGAIILANMANGSYQTTIKASNSATVAWTFTLPTSAGTNGYVLSTDGFGNTAWVAQTGGGGSGSPGGSTTQIQYNNAGVFGGDAAFAWDDTNKALTVGKASITTGTMKFGHASSAYLTGIKAGNATAAVTYTLPTADGATGAYLHTNGAGTLSWNAIPDPVAMALVFGS